MVPLLALPAHPDLILGGHDHEGMEVDVDGRLLLKGSADATSVQVVWVTVDADGGIAVDAELRALGPQLPERDPAVAARIASWADRLSADFCAGAELPAGCLSDRLGTAATPLVAEETTIRKRETSLANYLADLALAASPGADLALLNTGGMRLNQDVPAGPITRQVLEELFQYPTDLVVLTLTGAQVVAALENGVSKWPGSGRFPAVAGVRFRHDVTSGAITDVSVGGAPLDLERRYSAVVGTFIAGGGDGYAMLTDAPRKAVAGDFLN